MNKCAIYSLLLLAAVSCEGVIEYLDTGSGTEIVMNMQTSTDEPTHTLMLSQSSRNDISALEGAVVKVYVNGALKAEGKQETKDKYLDEVYGDWRYRDQTRYLIDCEFLPGDKVRIEVEHGGRKAIASTEVPVPSGLEKLDTLTVWKKDSIGELEEYLQFSATFSDSPGTDTYFRAEIFDYATMTGHFEKDGEKQHDDIVDGPFRSEVMYGVFSDPVLLDGYQSLDSDNVLSDFMPVNDMNTFSDRLFRDSRTTVHMHVLKQDYAFADFWFDDGEGNQLLASTTDIKGRTVFRLLTIDAKEYAYLKAINNFNTYGYDSSFIIEPTSLPTNVAGGIGFINIAAASVMSVEFERLGLKSRSSETIYY